MRYGIDAMTQKAPLIGETSPGANVYVECRQISEPCSMADVKHGAEYSTPPQISPGWYHVYDMHERCSNTANGRSLLEAITTFSLRYDHLQTLLY